MGSTFHSLHYHIVFSTKDRYPFFDREWRGSMHAYLGGTLRGLGAVPEGIGGVADHVHLLVGLKTTDAPAVVVRELKKSSSAWIKENHGNKFSWQNGYAIFSVSWSHVPAVREYIAGQEEHHRTFGFTEELQRMLERNGVAYDPKFLA